jgi:MraZ protein
MWKMAENAINEKTHYTGTFRHGLDDKRRVQVPARWRPSQPEAELTLIPWPSRTIPGAVSLLVLPPSRMAALAEKLSAMQLGDPRAEALRRLIGSKSAGVTVDKAGRVCIPEAMASLAGLKKEVEFVGMVDCFGVWDPDRHAAVMQADEALSGDAIGLI